MWHGWGVAETAKRMIPQQPLRVEHIALTDETLQHNEQAINTLIRREFSTLSDMPGRFIGKRLVELSQRQAALAALEKNLAIQQSGVTATIARNALLEAKAIFDPVLLLSFGYDRSERFKRTERDERFRPATRTDDEGRNVLGSEDPVDPRNPIAVFEDPQQDRFESTEIAASQPSLTGALETSTYNVALDQQLPWGARLELAYQAIEEDNFFVNNANLLVDNPNPPLDLISAGSYDRPWVSILLTRLALPVPGSKDFGPYAAQEVAIKLAKLDTESVYWDVKSVINNTLLQVDLTYWALINSLLNLQVIIENRKSVAELGGLTERLFAQGEATNYDKAQVDGELARIQNEEAQAWNSYVLASDALVQLLDMNPDTLLLPSGYSKAIKEVFAIPEDSQGALATRSNPEWFGAAVDVEAARIEEQTRAVRTRPDVSFFGEAEFRQSNTAFGYANFGESLENVFDPDIITQRYSLEYRYPLGNREVKGALVEAQANTRKQQIQARLIANRIRREFLNARAAFASATERVAITARQMKLAELAYQRAVRQQRDLTVRAYEVIVQNVQRLQARRDYIQALTEHQQAEARMLAAMGELAQTYAERTAQTKLDRYRLGLLTATGALRHFGETDGP
jgi:outer membrane protein TolC